MEGRGVLSGEGGGRVKGLMAVAKGFGEGMSRDKGGGSGITGRLTKGAESATTTFCNTGGETSFISQSTACSKTTEGTEVLVGVRQLSTAISEAGVGAS